MKILNYHIFPNVSREFLRDFTKKIGGSTYILVYAPQKKITSEISILEFFFKLKSHKLRKIFVLKSFLSNKHSQNSKILWQTILRQRSL